MISPNPVIGWLTVLSGIYNLSLEYVQPVACFSHFFLRNELRQFIGEQLLTN